MHNIHSVIRLAVWQRALASDVRTRDERRAIAGVYRNKYQRLVVLLLNYKVEADAGTYLMLRKSSLQGFIIIDAIHAEEKVGIKKSFSACNLLTDTVQIEP